MHLNSPLQLSLPVYLPDDETFNSYYPTVGNDELIHKLHDTAIGRNEAAIYLWGPAKSGRTHLLHAACAHANENDRTSFYIPLGIHASISPDLFEGLEAVNLVCIDDIDAIAGNPIWEEAVFDLFNRVADSKESCLIVSSSKPLKEANFLLQDLASRLQWGLNYQLLPLEDTDKLSALQRRAEMRGLQLSEDVGKFLLNRLQRDLRTLFDVLDKLDKASMVHQRKLTIPFIKEMLHL
ncbi:DnaA inactivator Hda [Parashewanella tropica]|uniref:DnaA inactivator Hda n=1 Tax=Parashewanella tropica TaxID=2547970 RepID=UPI0010595B01|nr:DnaA inactivator Hda [Parashewanella tropica]